MKKFNILTVLLFISFILAGQNARAQYITIKTDKQAVKNSVSETVNNLTANPKTEAQGNTISNINKTDISIIINKNDSTAYNVDQYSKSIKEMSDVIKQSTASAKALSSDAKVNPLSFGLEIEALLPLGSFADAVSFGGGVDVKGMYNVPSINGSITATIGYNYYASKSSGGGGTSPKYSGIPFKIGYLATFSNKFFVEHQLGFYSLRISDSGVSASNTNFLAGAHIGVNLKESKNGDFSRVALGYYHISASGRSYSFAGLSYYFSF